MMDGVPVMCESCGEYAYLTLVCQVLSVGAQKQT